MRLSAWLLLSRMMENGCKTLDIEGHGPQRTEDMGRLWTEKLVFPINAHYFKVTVEGEAQLEAWEIRREKRKSKLVCPNCGGRRLVKAHNCNLEGTKAWRCPDCSVRFIVANPSYLK